MYNYFIVDGLQLPVRQFFQCMREDNAGII